jgi:hypothetical protein
MYHTLQFVTEMVVDLEISPQHRLERLRLQQGTIVCAQVKPYVVETDQGPVEVADLFLDQGPIALAVPFACFRFAHDLNEADEQ